MLADDSLRGAGLPYAAEVTRQDRWPLVLTALLMPAELGWPALATLGAGYALDLFKGQRTLLALLKRLHVLRAPPRELVEVASQLADELRLPTPRLYVSRFHHAHAGAYPLADSVVVTDGLLQRLEPQEVRSILAYEYAHLQEPKHICRLRQLCASLILLFAGVVYIVLHTLGGKGHTHPCLYDRMHACGLEPDCPRPAGPPKGTLRKAWVIGLATLVIPGLATAWCYGSAGVAACCVDVGASEPALLLLQLSREQEGARPHALAHASRGLTYVRLGLETEAREELGLPERAEDWMGFSRRSAGDRGELPALEEDVSTLHERLAR